MARRDLLARADRRRDDAVDRLLDERLEHRQGDTGGRVRIGVRHGGLTLTREDREIHKVTLEQEQRRKRIDELM